MNSKKKVNLCKFGKLRNWETEKFTKQREQRKKKKGNQKGSNGSKSTNQPQVKGIIACSLFFINKRNLYETFSS